MSRSHLLRNASLATLMTLVVLFAGCFATKFTLIDPAKAKVERAYVGDWDGVNANGDHSSILIRNIDDKLYYVEIQGAADEKASRYTGFTADVKGATFAHLRIIQDDGQLPDTWLLMRIELANDRLNIRQLDEEFFKSKTIESAEQLRQILEQNLDADAMYDKDEAISATRVAQ